MIRVPYYALRNGAIVRAVSIAVETDDQYDPHDPTMFKIQDQVYRLAKNPAMEGDQVLTEDEANAKEAELEESERKAEAERAALYAAYAETIPQRDAERAARLQKLADRLGLSQQELADLVGETIAADPKPNDKPKPNGKP